MSLKWRQYVWKQGQKYWYYVGEGDVWKCHLSEETGKPSFSASKMFDSFYFTWDVGDHIQALSVAGKPFHTFVRYFIELWQGLHLLTAALAGLAFSVEQWKELGRAFLVKLASLTFWGHSLVFVYVLITTDFCNILLFVVATCRRPHLMDV